MAAALLNLSPIGRSGVPLDVAKAALWLASDGTPFVNGQVIAVDENSVTRPTSRTNWFRQPERITDGRQSEP